MNSQLWRAVELALPNGCLTLDVAKAGQFAQRTISFSSKGTSQIISSLSELAEALRQSQTSAEQLANSAPVSFAYLLCVLSGRPHHIFPRDTMWPELEEHFGLSRSASEPTVEQGKFVFVTYSQYLPTLTVSRITVDLSSLELKEEVLISSPWPPSSPTKA